MMGLVGKKCGMTSVFTDDGASIPVTVIEVLPNLVTQIKTIENDGYSAIQVTTGSRKRSRITKPLAGHFAKAKVEGGRGLWEFTLPAEKIEALLSKGSSSNSSDEGEPASPDDAGSTGNALAGNAVTVDFFAEGQVVDVTGTSIGKGFAGAVKRHNFKMQDATHGNSLSHRAPGSIGQNQSPGRVFKGKKMAGHMGNVQRTVQNLKIIRIDSERNLLLISGAVPGASGFDVIVKPAVKKLVDGA